MYFLQDLDDMESDLFGGSLGKKTTPKKPTKSAKTTSEPKKINTDNEPTPSVDSTGAKTSSQSSAKSMLLPVGIVTLFKVAKHGECVHSSLARGSC